jgi:hypothetical protein
MNQKERMGKKVANNHNQKIVVLRCYSNPEKRNGVMGHLAVCIDLNLVTWRENQRAAHDSLMEAIEGYIQTAAEISENPSEFESLISKRAPLFPHRATYHWIALLSALSSNSRDKNRPAIYNSPVEVPA